MRVHRILARLLPFLVFHCSTASITDVDDKDQGNNTEDDMRPKMSNHHADSKSFLPSSSTRRRRRKLDNVGDQIDKCWEQQGNKLRGEALDHLGGSISLSNDGLTLAVGGDGFTKVYTHTDSGTSGGGSWTQLGETIQGEEDFDLAGFSVSISANGRVIAIGAPDNGDFYGHVRILGYNDASQAWEQLGEDIDGDVLDGSFGSSVSLSDDGLIIAVGSVSYTSSVSSTQMYECATPCTEWKKMGQTINGNDDDLGISTSLSSNGRTVAIGANRTPPSNTGSVIVYKFDETSEFWTQRGSPIAGKSNKERFGTSVSLSSNGDVVAVGADYSNDATGQVRIYAYDETSGDWDQHGQDIDGKAKSDYFGSSVALSGDGLKVVVGAWGNGDNGSNSGQARVFEFNATESNWVQFGQSINGQEGGDHFGDSVSISSGGESIAIGGHYHDGKAGYVQVLYNTNSSCSITSSPSATPSISAMPTSNEPSVSFSPSAYPSLTPSLQPVRGPTPRSEASILHQKYYSFNTYSMVLVFVLIML